MQYRVVPLAMLFFCGCASYEIARPPVQRNADSLSEVFQRVRTSVVVVRTKEKQYNPLPTPLGGQRLVSVRGQGSGFLARKENPTLVITAAHVVQAADDLVVEFAGGRTIPAKVIASSPAADVALLELPHPPPGMRPVPLGDSDKVSVGDVAFVVGAPYGLDHTLTVGHVGAKRTSQDTLGGLMLMELLQTDASINVGNSGGPMFNTQGEVIGIVSHILSRSGGFEGTGFAVTSNLARRLLLDEPSRWSGLDGYLVSGDLAEALNLPQKAGLLVQRVARNSPAERLGLVGGRFPAQFGNEKLLVGGDIVLAVGGVIVEAKPESYKKLQSVVRDIGENDVLSLQIVRDGKILELSKRMRDL